MNKILSLFLTFSLLAGTSFAQDKHLVDSLEAHFKVLQTTGKNDTQASDILYQLSVAHWGNNPEKAMEYAKQTLNLAERINYKKGIGNAYNSMGAINKDKGAYIQALELYTKSLKIRKEIGDKKGIAGSYGNIGVIYDFLGKYPEALKNQLNALKIREEIGDKKGIATAYNNIAIIYYAQHNLTEALKQYLAALKIREEIGDKIGIGNSYNNIAVLYEQQRNLAEALKNHYIALKIKEEIGDKNGIANSYTNIGNIYLKQNNIEEALKQFFTSLKIFEEIGDQAGIASCYNAIGTAYKNQKKYDEAFLYMNKALDISKKLNSIENIHINYQSLALLDSARANTLSIPLEKRTEYALQALVYTKLYYAYSDSLINKENTEKLVQTQMQYEFDKQQQIDHEKHQAELKNRNIIGLALVGGIALLCIIVYLIWKRSQLLKASQLTTQKNLEEKEILLREIHHRVKNNLAVISGLLYLQKNRVSDEHIKAVLLEGQNRIDSMVLVHEMLYQSNNIASIELQSYLKKLIGQIAGGFEHQILAYSITGDLTLEPKQAVPLGLILTELITNIYKYAYPMGTAGKYHLQLSSIGENKIQIELNDYGKGLPEGFDVSKSKSLGLKLVNMLVQQMQGSIAFKNEGGTQIIMSFNYI